MNNKGFTLVEVLVALSISALILIMAIPSINVTSGELKDKEYLQYKNSIIYGARLYYKQRSSDLGLNGTSGTATVNFNDLKNAGYVKTFVPTQKSSKKRCDTSTTKVIITKANNKVSYKLQGLMCGTGAAGHSLREIK